jgi:hypothetical protein
MTKLEMLTFMAEAAGEIFTVHPSPESYERFARFAGLAKDELERRIGLTMRESDVEGAQR